MSSVSLGRASWRWYMIWVSKVWMEYFKKNILRREVCQGNCTNKNTEWVHRIAASKFWLKQVLDLINSKWTARQERFIWIRQWKYLTSRLENSDIILQTLKSQITRKISKTVIILNLKWCVRWNDDDKMETSTNWLDEWSPNSIYGY